MTQASLPIAYLYQPPVANDTAVQFAPYNTAMQIHLKGESCAATRCGLVLPREWGEWAAMGSFSKHLASAPDTVCEGCKK